MTTPARYRALQWFHDHEAEGPLAVLRRERPSVRMRNLMERERQLMRIELGQFNHHRWLLTGMGEQVLAEKREAKAMEDVNEEKNELRKMLDLNGVLGIVPIARSTLLRMVKLKQFPQPTYISENRRVWYEDQIIAWQKVVDNSQPQRRRGPGRPRVKRVL